MSLHGAGLPFAIINLLGKLHYLLLASTLLKPRVKYQLEIFMHEIILGTNYINSREMFCEMMFEANPKGYLIFAQCSQKL
jgi:hypothetical protein